MKAKRGILVEGNDFDWERDRSVIGSVTSGYEQGCTAELDSDERFDARVGAAVPSLEVASC